MWDLHVFGHFCPMVSLLRVRVAHWLASDRLRCVEMPRVCEGSQGTRGCAVGCTETTC